MSVITAAQLPGFHQDAQGRWVSNNGPSGRDDQGRQFYTKPDGSKFFYAPQVNDPSIPKDSFLRNSVWDTNTGTWKRKTDWGHLAVLGAGALIGGGALNAAMGGSTAAGGITPGILTNTAPDIGAAVAPSGVGAGMGFWSSLGGSAAINAGANVVGGIVQTRSNNNAAKVQAQSAKEALDFAKAQYAKAVKDYEPFLALSTQAAGGMSDLLAHPPQVTQGQYGSVMQPYPQMTNGGGMRDLIPVGNGQTPGAAANGQPKLVTLRAPNGQTRQFAANDPRVPQFLTMPDKNGQVAQRVA